MEEIALHVKIFHDFISNAAIAEGKYPALPLDQALKKFFTEILDNALENAQFGGRIEVLKMEMPNYLYGDAANGIKALESQVLEDLEHYTKLLSSDGVTAEIRADALKKFTRIIREQPMIADRCPSVGGNHVIEVNGVKIPLEPKVFDTIKGYIVKGEKIQAIKELRMASGLGLKESKDAVENPAFWI